MRQPGKLSLLGAAIFAFSLGYPAAGKAQEAPVPYTQVFSVNPIGLLFEFFNAEYERVFSANSTIGASGSYLGLGGANFTSLDAKYRYYPQGTPLQGFSAGGTLGLARIGTDADTDLGGEGDSGSAFSLGVEFDYNWLLWSQNRFFVGVGVGAKRYFGSDLEDVSFTVPTIRLVNIGYAF